MSRKRLSLALGVLALVAAACLSRADEADVKADAKLLQQAGVATDGPGLLTFFKQRSLDDIEMIQVEALIQQLGSKSFAKREVATSKLIARGPVIVPILKKYFDDPDLEVASRAQKCVKNIQEKDYSLDVLRAAARLIADRKPAGAAGVMLQYLPFADSESVADEVRGTLTQLARQAAKADPALVKGLTDKNPVVRSAAGEALALARVKDHEAAVWKLLDDPDTLVKFRVALGLTLSGQAKAVPTLIGLTPSLDQSQAWQVEYVLYRLAKGHEDVPNESLGQTKKAREKFAGAWSAWWQKHGGTVDLAELKAAPKMLGFTLLVFLEAGQVRELGPNNEIRWQINNLNFPLDVQYLPNDRVLVAEYHGGRVTERDLQGNVKWQYPIFNPQAAQRLKNGNTFIVCDTRLIEVDENKVQKFSHEFANGDRVMKAVKLDDGRMVCLMTTLANQVRMIVLDQNRKLLKSKTLEMAKHLFGGRLYVTATNRVLIPYNQENKVVEYDLNGVAGMSFEVDQPVAAVPLANGHTLVTTMSIPGKVIEFDRAGKEAWSYRAQGNSKITRALRR